MLLDRYIAKNIIRAVFSVVLVLVAIESFMEFAGQISQIGKNGYGVGAALLYVPLQLPTDLYELFPMAGFLGCLIGLGKMAANSELVVMRSSGLSITQITWIVVKAACAMIIVVTLIGEVVAPIMKVEADALKQGSVKHYAFENKWKGVWLKDHDAYMYIEQVDSPGQVGRVTRVVSRADRDEIASIAFARSGERVNGHWVLHDIDELILPDLNRHTATQPSVTKVHRSREALNINLKPDLLNQVQSHVDRDSIVVLLKNILYRKETGLVTSQFEYAFWKRLFQPITTIVMICLGVPFIFGSLRSVSMGQRIIMGVIIGFGFYMLNQFFGPISLLYQFPPYLAAMLPTLLFAAVYVILRRYVLS